MQFNLHKEIKIDGDIFDARFHPTKENLIAVVTLDGNVYLLDDGAIKTTLHKHHKGSPIRRVQFDKNGHMITVAKTVKIHDLETNQTKQALKRNDDQKTIFNATLALGSSTVCAGDDAGKVFVWDTRASNDGPIMSSNDCDQYISDMDGKYEARRMFLCTSGEGTLTAYDLRANKMIEQSELFEAGFQCVKMVELNKKVVIGGEDGAVYVFNQNQWAHTSGKYAISDDAQNRGKCSIEGIDVIPGSSVYVVACSDGKMRSFSLWPHQVLLEKAVCKRRSLECIEVSPISGRSDIVVAGENYINILNYKEESEDEEDEGVSQTVEKLNDSHDSKKSADEENVGGSQTVQQRRPLEQHTNEKQEASKKPKINNDDYLNIFN